MFVICTFDDHRGKNDDSDGSEHNNYGSEPEHNIMLGILVKPWLTVVRLRLRRISQHSESDCYFLRFNALVGYKIYMMEVSVLVWIYSYGQGCRKGDVEQRPYLFLSKKYVMMNTDRIDAESSVVSFNEMAGNCENESKKEIFFWKLVIFFSFFTRKPCKQGVE